MHEGEWMKGGGVGERDPLLHIQKREICNSITEAIT